MNTIKFNREMHKEWVRLETLMTGDFFTTGDDCDSPLYFLLNDEPFDNQYEVYSFGHNDFIHIDINTLVLQAYPTNITYELVC